MEAIDILDVDYVIDTSDPPRDYTANAFEGMKVLVGDKLYVATEATYEQWRCDHCQFAVRSVFGEITCMIPQKPFWCRSDDRDFYLIAADAYKGT